MGKQRLQLLCFLLFLCVLLARRAGGQSTGVYPHLEASFGVTNLATDPFDYTVTDLRVQVTQPDGSKLSLPAFYDGGTTWRVRHTPAMPGLYQVSGITLNGLSLVVSNLQPASWMVTGQPWGPGFVGIDPSNTNRFMTGNGRRYFPLGHDVAWWTNNTQIPGVLAKLGGARENWTRIWMMEFYDTLNLEWPPVGPLGQFSLPVAQKWDAIVSAAEQSGVFIQLTLQHHGQYSSIPGSNVNPQWEQNPYNSANGGFLTNAILFFADATARALTKRKYRYIIARWGYSPAIMGWELFNEVQFTDAAYAGQWTNIAAWHDEMAQFVHAQDSYHHLVTTSSELDQPIWSQCDYYQHHDYPSDLITGLQDGPVIPAGDPAKPIYAGECGRDFTPFLGFHAPLWAGLMAGQSGAGQQWYSDQLEAENAYSLYKAGRDFVIRSGLGEQDAVAKSVLHVTCPVIGPLAFAPGGGWATASQSTFTVGDVAPDGIGSLPSYLQGFYHHGMTPNAYTFQVNYSVTGTFSAQVLQIAGSGANLTIYLDGVTASSVTWPSSTNDVSTNYTSTITVPAGAHTVALTNASLDWVLLGNLTLNPYASMLAAYQVANTNFAALWFWHRTNIYYTNASAALSGTAPLSALQPGTYSGTWWDTFAGVALSNFNFTVAGTNAVTLATPPVLRSVAFFAGPPARATVRPPVLTQNLATNSPVLNLPLILTNAGGLPLAYSLSVTGIAPIIYSARNSTQPGGPMFAWRDISSAGQDITTNFTALTGKGARDEGIAGPINLGFGFPFFSGGQSPDIYSQIYVSPNGFVTFSPFGGDTSTNRALPSSLAPSNCVAFFWDDLDLTSAGKIYYATDSIAGTCTLQFQNAPIKGTAANVTCQLVLKTTGEIVMQYKTIGVSNACTAGVQNAARNQGLLVAYNQPYLQSGMAVRLTPTPWLALTGARTFLSAATADVAGVVPRWNAETFDVSMDPTQVPIGAYSATLLVKTADPSLALTALPINLSVLAPIDLWRLNNFGTTSNSGIAADGADPDHDGLVNLVEYALGLNPNVPNPNPLSFALAGGHLVVTYKRPHPTPADITYINEVTVSLSAGSWNSGSAYVTQGVVNNNDGTETVTVTDLASTASAPTHYLRVRFSK